MFARLNSMKAIERKITFAFGCVLILASYPVAAQVKQRFPVELIRAGAKTYDQRCSTCHGRNMKEPDTDLGAIDLKFFPHDEHDRFVDSVTNGKNTMPAWGGVITKADIEALWAYVCAGEN